MLLEPRAYFKPLSYPWAFDAYELQNKMHWIPGEVPLHEDVKDWNSRLSVQERNLLTQLFRFFTQADIDIAKGYIEKYMPTFKPPEVRMMLSSFANMEATHVHAYSLLLDTIGMPEIEYKAFQDYEDMSAKHDYLDACSMDDPIDIARSLAIYSAFGEGLQLFSSFAMLLNFPRTGKMKGMGQIVSWSLKDEDLHVTSMIKLYHTLVREYGEEYSGMQETLEDEIPNVCDEMVQLEDKFIDLAYRLGGPEDLPPEDVKKYIRFTADKRMLQLGLSPIYGVKDNPLPWLDWLMSGVEHANFFETKSSEYSKISWTGSWEDVWG